MIELLIECLWSSHSICLTPKLNQAHRRGGGGLRGSNEPPLEVNNGGLKTHTVEFQLLANSGEMENKL